MANSRIRRRERRAMQQDEDWAREMIRRTVQEVLEQEMTERVSGAYRAGYYERTLVTASAGRRFSQALPAARRRWWRPWRRCTSRESPGAR